MKPQRESKIESGFSEKIAPPSFFRVIFLNDDYTTMEFVVSVLESVFRKTNDEAFEIMMNVHQNGSGVAGVYPFDLAKSRAEKAMNLARGEGFPLQINIEEAEA